MSTVSFSEPPALNRRLVRTAGVLCSLAAAAGLAGQSGLFKPTTILEQIRDPAERAAFGALFKDLPPARARDLAREFAARFPQSAYIAQAWEIAAKACMDLQDRPCALEYSRQAVRILPENATLLVPLAKMRLEAGEMAAAARSAGDALDCLDRFGPPPGFPHGEWAEQETGLRASALYIFGVATAGEARKKPGDERRLGLQQAEQSLARAWRLAPGDTRIAYVLGLTRMAQLRPAEAAAAFAFAYTNPGPFQAQAGERLRYLHSLSTAGKRADFAEFVRESARAEENAPGPEAGGIATPPSAFAGSDSCRECHRKEYSGWEQTGHARMIAPYRPENVIGDFQNQIFRDDRGAVVARMTLEGGRHYFHTLGDGTGWRKYRVDFTIGSKWQQTYATQLRNGEIHVFPLQYNVLDRRWVPFWKNTDPPGTARGEVANFPRLAADTDYKLNCATCHTGQLRHSGPGPVRSAGLAFREPGINCEACHGPSQAHVEAMRAAKPGERPPLRILEFGRLGNRDYVAICAVCHMQSADRTPGPRGEINYLESGFPRFRSTPYAWLTRRGFYKDGRFRVVSLVVESFVRSACYRKGGAHCGHCHDVHPPDARTNDRGLRAGFLREPDGMCLQCHPEYAGKLAAHTHHKAASEGSRCTACHMPKIMNTVGFKAMSHQIDEIPDAAMTARFGQQESPNACQICHAGEDAAWTARFLAEWYGRARGAK